MAIPTTYDAIVIGGGQNGLTSAAYLACAGRRVLVLERRHVLGGAAVTEEVFPGFRFSVRSYVVSLLRPEIIRDLDLPRHGLEILPLDGTFTPMPNGDYLWRVNDHARTRREIARHSRLDAEAYDEYGKAMVEMARFVKPILEMTPPDPMARDPRQSLVTQRFPELPGQYPVAGGLHAFRRPAQRASQLCPVVDRAIEHHGTLALTPDRPRESADAEPHAFRRGPFGRLRAAMLQSGADSADLVAVTRSNNAVDSSHDSSSGYVCT